MARTKFVCYSVGDVPIYYNPSTYTFTNVYGCDSVVSLDLSLLPLSSSTDTQVHCNEYTWLDGITYFESNDSVNYITEGFNGCDSIITLDLTINYSTSDTFNITECNGYTWINGITYYESGTYIFQNTNTYGCSHLNVLNLTIENNCVFIGKEAELFYEYHFNDSINLKLINDKFLETDDWFVVRNLMNSDNKEFINHDGYFTSNQVNNLVTFSGNSFLSSTSYDCMGPYGNFDCITNDEQFTDFTDFIDSVYFDQHSIYPNSSLIGFPIGSLLEGYFSFVNNLNLFTELKEIHIDKVFTSYPSFFGSLTYNHIDLNFDISELVLFREAVFKCG